MGKKEKIVIPKPRSDYFNGVTVDVKDGLKVSVVFNV